MNNEEESRERNLELIARLLGRPVTPKQTIPKPKTYRLRTRWG